MRQAASSSQKGRGAFEQGGFLQSDLGGALAQVESLELDELALDELGPRFFASKKLPHLREVSFSHFVKR